MTTHDRSNHVDLQMDADALLTAFALGELDGSAADAVAARIAADAECAAEVEAIRRTADMLGTALAAELTADPAPELSPAQRAAIAAGPPPERDAVIFTFRRAFGTLGLAAAACFVIAVVTLRDMSPPSPNDVAINAPIESGESIVPGDFFANKRERKDADHVSRPNDTTRALAVKDETNGGDDRKVDESRFAAPAQTPAPPTSSEEVAGRILALQRQADRIEAAGATSGVELGVAFSGAAPAAPAATRAPQGPPAATSGRRAGSGLGGGGPVSGAASRAGALDAQESPGEAGAGAPGAAPPREHAEAEPEADARVGRVRARLRALENEIARDAARPPADAEKRGVEDRLEAKRSSRTRFEPDTATAGDAPTGRGFAEDRRLDRDNREEYARITDNPFEDPSAAANALSTFSIDVDTASYANVRSMIRSGIAPPPGAVRIEEMINAFDYDYAPPAGDHPFAVHVDIADAPWNPEHRLARIGLKGLEVDPDMRPATNLVFLVDVSGSMSDRNKLPLVRESLSLLLENLTPDDRVSIVTYAGSSGVLLPTTYCHDRETIQAAIDSLRSGGSTNGGAGIRLAYDEARRGFIEGGVNRVILCTDGDFNVGLSSEDELVRLIEQERESHVFLCGLGFGRGNYQDAKMEAITNAGNGIAGYIDSIEEARRVLVDRMAGTLVTIAQDVKIQVEFNPQKVGAYRLIGYANRMLAAQDFADDRVDAGDIGAGHTVTALYELVPRGEEAPLVAGRQDDELRYQRKATTAEHAYESFIVKLRYKQPTGDVSTLLEVPVTDTGSTLDGADDDFRFAACVAGFGMLLRQSPYRGDITWEDLLGLLRQADTAADPMRTEMVELVEQAKGLME